MELKSKSERIDILLNARQLHGDRGPADLPVLLDIGMPDCPDQRSRAHPRMEPEPLILVQERGIDKDRRYGFQRQPQAVLVVTRKRQAEELAAPVIDRLGETHVGLEGGEKEAEENYYYHDWHCNVRNAFYGTVNFRCIHRGLRRALRNCYRSVICLEDYFFLSASIIETGCSMHLNTRVRRALLARRARPAG